MALVADAITIYSFLGDQRFASCTECKNHSLYKLWILIMQIKNTLNAN